MSCVLPCKETPVTDDEAVWECCEAPLMPEVVGKTESLAAACYIWNTIYWLGNSRVSTKDFPLVYDGVIKGNLLQIRLETQSVLRALPKKCFAGFCPSEDHKLVKLVNGLVWCPWNLFLWAILQCP